MCSGGFWGWVLCAETPHHPCLRLADVHLPTFQNNSSAKRYVLPVRRFMHGNVGRCLDLPRNYLLCNNFLLHFTQTQQLYIIHSMAKTPAIRLPRRKAHQSALSYFDEALRDNVKPITNAILRSALSSPATQRAVLQYMSEKRPLSTPIPDADLTSVRGIEETKHRVAQMVAEQQLGIQEAKTFVEMLTSIQNHLVADDLVRLANYAQELRDKRKAQSLPDVQEYRPTTIDITPINNEEPHEREPAPNLHVCPHTKELQRQPRWYNPPSLLPSTDDIPKKG